MNLTEINLATFIPYGVALAILGFFIRSWISVNTKAIEDKVDVRVCVEVQKAMQANFDRVIGDISNLNSDIRDMRKEITGSEWRRTQYNPSND